MNSFDIVVIGTSAGGLSALATILTNLEDHLDFPIVIVQHMSADSGDSVLNLLKKYSTLELTEPIDKERVLGNHIYLAPPDYHLMIERDHTFTLTLDPKINYCRPSVDVLFETAAEAYLEKTLGIVLTGANRDGTEGALAIKKFSGVVIAQDPEEAKVNVMPQCVIDSGSADYILTLKGICSMLNKINKDREE